MNRNLTRFQHVQHSIFHGRFNVYDIDLKIELERRDGKVENELWESNQHAHIKSQGLLLLLYQTAIEKCFRILNRVSNHNMLAVVGAFCLLLSSWEVWS